MVKDIEAGPFGSIPQALTVMGGKLYFSAFSPASGAELWVSDGTNAGTMMVKDINIGSGSGVVTANFILLNNKLYFNGNDGAAGEELWESDGTAAGTVMVKDIWAGATGSYPTQLAVHSGKLYFRASDGTNGYEPWMSDGTATGTVMVKDINPGSGDSNPMLFVSYKKYVYFLAYPASGPQSIYQSNGTATGTIAVAPASITSLNPLFNTGSFFMYDSTLFFSAAYMTATGQELWSMKDTTTYPPPPNSINYNVETGDNIAIVYPNPAHNNFTIKANISFKQGSMRMTDVTGRVVKTLTLNPNAPLQIPLNGIASGMYMADVLLDDKRSMQRLVVE
jgi:ELWxxDGT repeat protein